MFSCSQMIALLFIRGACLDSLNSFNGQIQRYRYKILEGDNAHPMDVVDYGQAKL